MGNFPLRLTFHRLYLISNNNKKGMMGDIGVLIGENMVWDFQ